MIIRLTYIAFMANPVLFIRRHVLGLSQAGLAAALETTQASVSRWEKAGHFPSEHLATIRQMGRAKRADWSDSWFFEPPAPTAERRAS